MTPDVDPLLGGQEAAWDWCARHRVPWALTAAMRRASSTTRSVRWSAARRAFLVEDVGGRELAAHPADDPFWRSDAEAAAWRAPAVAAAADPTAPVTCECGLVVTYGADLPLHRMGDVHRERMAGRAAA